MNIIQAINALRLIVFIFISLLLLSCLQPDGIEVYYPGQEPNLNAEQNAKKGNNEYENGRIKHQVTSIMRRCEVVFEPSVRPFNIDVKLRRCIEFLVDLLGDPLYHEKIVIVITQDPKDNGRMIWQHKGPRERVIRVHIFNLRKNSELRILVHELCHALYQTTGFIEANPNIITEGIAIYAECRYRFPSLTDKEIAQELDSFARAIDQNYKNRLYDFDAPFIFSNGAYRDLLYYIGGLVFFAQPYADNPKMIRDILCLGSSFRTRQKFEDLAHDYGIIRAKPFSQANAKKSPILSKPKEIFGGMVGSAAIKKTVKEHGIAIVNGDSDKCKYIQYAFYKHKKYAERELKKLVTRKLSVKVEQIKKPSGYSVIVGPFYGKKDASLALKYLEGFSDTPNDIRIINGKCR